MQLQYEEIFLNIMKPLWKQRNVQMGVLRFVIFLYWPFNASIVHKQVD